jgi:hypothetical protein
MERTEDSPYNDDRPLILAHYMPWYQTPTGSAGWGWHWAMEHFSPGQKDENGRSSIASHYYPLTGLYDSGDHDLLEYQVMLMKISGIDGVIVDWYGFEEFWDYGKINSSTHKLFEQVKKVVNYPRRPWKIIGIIFMIKLQVGIRWLPACSQVSTTFTRKQALDPAMVI